MIRLATAAILLAILTLSPNFASAQTQNIATVDAQSAMIRSNVGQQMFQTLEQDPEYQLLVESRNEIFNDIQNLLKMAAQYPEGSESRTRAKQTATDIETNLRLVEEKIRARRSAVIVQLSTALNAKLRESVLDLIDEKGITMLVNFESVYYAKPFHDLTDDVVAKLNEG